MNSHFFACVYFPLVVPDATRCVHFPLTRSDMYTPPFLVTIASSSARSSCVYPVTHTHSPRKALGTWPTSSTGRSSPASALSRSHAEVTTGLNSFTARSYLGELVFFVTQ